jgi:peroxiredoxin
MMEVTAEMGSPHPGDAAPDFELPDQNGRKVKLASLRGSVVVLAFVTSWCPFSKAEQPSLKTLADDYKGKNVKFLAVDINEEEEDYKLYLSRVPIPFPVLRDESGDVARSYAPPRAQPSFKDRSRVTVTSNLVIDPQGTIRFFGLVDTVNFDDKLVHVRHAVDALLAQAGPK